MPLHCVQALFILIEIQAQASTTISFLIQVYTKLVLFFAFIVGSLFNPRYYVRLTPAEQYGL